MEKDDFQCPEVLKEFYHFAPESKGDTQENRDQLMALLREIYADQNKSDEEIVVLDEFQKICQLSDEAVVEYEKLARKEVRLPPEQGADCPVSLFWDQSREVEAGCEELMRVVVYNHTGNVLHQVRVHFDVRVEQLEEVAEGMLGCDGHADAAGEYLFQYRAPKKASKPPLKLRVEICNHRRHWTAYHSRGWLKLEFPGSHERAAKLNIEASGGSLSRLRDVALEQFGEINIVANDGALADVAGLGLNSSGPDKKMVTGFGGYMDFIQGDDSLPIPLEFDWKRTDELNQENVEITPAIPQIGRKGTPATRAMLLRLSEKNFAVPKRIELVSRPLALFGRAKNGRPYVGDFGLNSTETELLSSISRFHLGVRCAGDSMQVVHLGTHPTQLNEHSMPQGEWLPLNHDDVLELARLHDYQIKVSFSMMNQPYDPAVMPLMEQAEQKMREVWEALGKRDLSSTEQKEAEENWAVLQQLQTEMANQLGEDISGPLRYARFYRVGDELFEEGYIYLPRQLPIGSSEEMGLFINAENIPPYQGEIAFRQGMYWIENKADEKENPITVNGKSISLGRSVPMEHGDEIHIGEVPFRFETY